MQPSSDSVLNDVEEKTEVIYGDENIIDSTEIIFSCQIKTEQLS
jgi:hypothetical protein